MNRWVFLACAVGRLVIGCASDDTMDGTPNLQGLTNRPSCAPVGEPLTLAFRAVAPTLRCECKEEYKSSGCFGESCESSYDRGTTESNQVCAVTATGPAPIESAEAPRFSASPDFGHGPPDCIGRASVRAGTSDVVDVVVTCREPGGVGVYVQVRIGRNLSSLTHYVQFVEDGRCPQPDGGTEPDADGTEGGAVSDAGSAVAADD